MNYFSEIVGTGSQFPETVMTNKDFESFIETSDEWIQTRTGIRERRIASKTKNETTLSLARGAALKALEMAGLKGSDLDLIIIGTVTPEMIMPTTANLLQADLGAINAFTFDMQSACSGFLYGLTIADQFIRCGSIKTALVIGAETLSTLINWRDRSTCILFGDGAGAAIIKRTTSDKSRVLGSSLHSDGTKFDILKIPHGYARTPIYSAEYRQDQHKIIMQGTEVFKLAVRAMCDTSVKILKDCNVELSQVDFFIFHQANIRILDMCMKSLGVPPEKTWINLDRYGNTSAATLPVCLDEAWRAGKVKKGDTILLATFGGGVTWGATLIRL